MLWINIVVGAICGAVAGGIVHLLTRKSKNKNRSGITAVMMAVLIALSSQFVTPHISNHYRKANLSDALLKNPTYSAIKQYDPATYSKILNQLESTTKEGKSQDEAIAIVRGNITAFIQKRIPFSSNEAVASYMKVMVQELMELQKAGGELCYYFLFPQPGQPSDMSKFISASTAQADQNTLAEVIKSSSVAPQLAPTEESILPLLQPIIIELLGEYGNDISILEKAEASGVDKAKVCSMTIALYDRILQLPPSQGGKIVRYMFSQTQ